MKELSDIHNKLEVFIKKYYKNKIVRGGLIQLILTLLAYLLVISSEFFGHFSIPVRTFIFFSVILILVLTLLFYIVKPFLSLYKLRKSIDSYQANEILQAHFPELKDQLRNILELEEMQSSDLINKAIQQKSSKISVIPFSQAIKTKKNYNYAKILTIPLLILLSLFIFSPQILLEGTERLVNYNQFYEKPSAFKFIIKNDSLVIHRGENLNLKITTEGEYIPYPIYVRFGEREYLLQKDKKNLFSYEFKNINQNFKFSLVTEEYQSKPYQIKVLPIPQIINFSIKISAPEYTQIPEKTINNNGDFICPIGSLVEWNFKTKDIDNLWIGENDSILKAILLKNNYYSTKRVLKKDMNYTIGVANKTINKTKHLKFLAQIIPDEFPNITVQSVIDSTLPTAFYFKGQVDDDYGIKELNFCYAFDESEKTTRIKVPILLNRTLQEFYYAFDFKTIAEQGEQISYYFEVWDNDAINGSKQNRTQQYQFYLPSKKEIEKIEEKNSKSIQDKLMKSQELAKELQKDVKNLKKDLVNKDSDSWQVNKKLAQIAKKQDKLEQLMDEVAKENKKNNELLKNLNKDEQRMLEKQQQIEDLLNQLMDEEMKKLMEEINKLMDEFNKDEFNEMTEEMEMKYEDLEEQLDRNLEELKRFEVEKKMQKTIDDLKNLAKEHEQLSKDTKEEQNKEDLEKRQEEQQKKMDDIAKKYEETKQKNKALEKPMKMDDMSSKMEDLKQEMKESAQSMQKGKSGKASKQQKSTSAKMDQLADEMQEQMDQEMQEQQEQDMEALRQIIENLNTFSFEQEDLMLNFRGLRYKDPKYIQNFNKQTKLAKNFIIIKDSLKALAHTQPMIAAPINKELLIIERELNKTKDALDERRSRKAQSAQQVVMMSANNLSLLLREMMDQMVLQMQSKSQCKKAGNCKKPGGGKPKPGFGQPKKQAQSLKQQMQNMLKQMKKGNGKGKGKKGKKPSKGELGKMIAEQEKMQKMLQDLSNSQGISPQTAKKLKEIKNISKQVENDLINQNITPTTLKRQELILTRLLEAENSEFKRDQDNKRESNSVLNQKLSSPKDMFKSKEEKQINDDILNKSNIKLKQFYKEKYKEYIINLNN